MVNPTNMIQVTGLLSNYYTMKKGGNCPEEGNCHTLPIVSYISQLRPEVPLLGEIVEKILAVKLFIIFIEKQNFIKKSEQKIKIKRTIVLYVMWHAKTRCV